MALCAFVADQGGQDQRPSLGIKRRVCVGGQCAARISEGQQGKLGSLRSVAYQGGEGLRAAGIDGALHSRLGYVG